MRQKPLTLSALEYGTRIVSAHLSKDVARRMTMLLIEETRRIGIKRLSFETGKGDRWMAARRMYEGCEFKVADASGGYLQDGSSMFMDL
jgi:hypothetical protein